MKEENKGLEIDSKSKDLIKKWKKQADSLKKKHPKWNAEKVQQEMKKRIIQEAKEALSSKSGQAYMEEVNAHLREVEDVRKKAIDGIMAYMGKKSPEAIATVLFELDCGCIRACAVSQKGTPMGEMIMVSGKQVEKDYECSICRDDGGADPRRCIRKALVWPGEESELPSEEFRLDIGKKVFGDDYSLGDI
ncbi:hypothetical protein JWG39_14585 [Desulforhopalus vacuolatus]|uniref:hypothetical protein n=1 Tax=Desulforhopalus vacuolatus TaxID=40414 RepID=UPI001965F4DC|nr:hypothetical protein [Desulforhopalus vacuolatus]MBM9521045.1 hypothetical protein [Desulforhopalus vacuolatus]